MRTQSAKAKGRRWQQEVEMRLKEIFTHLEGNDILSRPMGSQGSDLILSSEAMKVLPYDFEMKNQEKSKIWEDIRQSELRLVDGVYPVLMLKKNRLRGVLKSGITILPFAHYCYLLCQHLGCIDLGHMVSASDIFMHLYDQIPPSCPKEALRKACDAIYSMITGHPCVMDTEGRLCLEGYPNHPPIGWHDSTTMNIWKEFKGPPILFSRNSAYHTIFIAITSDQFYNALRALQAKSKK